MLSNDSVLSLYQEPSGRLWIGTDGGGLNTYDPIHRTITKFDVSDGLPSNVIYGILRDDANHLWLTTSKGLVRFDLATTKAVTFTSADGLGSTEFAQNTYFRSTSGKFFVGTLTGFNRFDPKSIVPDSFVPPAVITSFRVFDKERALPRPIWDTPEVELSYRDSVFTVEFATLAFEAPETARYQYMLEGFRNEWMSTDRGKITFTNLDAGTYVLNIKTVNRHGIASATPTKLRLHIEPPPWRTKPAYALYLALLIGAGLLAVRLLRQRLLRVEREGRLALVEQELALTGAVQSGFLPASNDITTRQVRITGGYKPAESCGGDWWWHALLNDRRHLVIVGDVTGHGAGPAMVTAAVATAFQVFAATQSYVDIDEMLELLNRVVLRIGKGNYQMTLAMLELDENNGSWTLYNVGAPPILTLDRTGKHKVHFCPGSLLGTEDNFTVGKLSGTLASTDRILLYSDGIPEIQLPNGKMLGQRKFAQIYEQTRSQPVNLAAASLMNQALSIQGRQPQLDDWTFVLVEWVRSGVA
jgi:serine phosphatase RsbU (regulator of sigma subunit)